jgi:hypothetical protein
MDDTSRRVGKQSGNDRLASELAADNGGVVKVTMERVPAPSEADADTERRTSEIRQEIDHTRAEMTETIDAIQAKLNPRNIVANATERVKAATTERVREMAGTAGDTAQEVMNQTRDTAGGIVQSVQQNPVPAALIGLGAAWLLMNRSGSIDRERGYRPAPRQNRSYSQEGDGIVGTVRSNPIPAVLAGVGLGWLMYSGRDKPTYGSERYGYGSERYGYGGERWAGTRDQRWNEASGVGDSEGLASSVSESAGRIASRAKDYVGETGQELQYQGRRAQNQFQRMLEDSPLLVGAGALMIGAAFGLAVPETDVENQWMGEARDTVVERTQEMAQNAASQVQQAAAGLTDAATKQSS